MTQAQPLQSLDQLNANLELILSKAKMAEVKPALAKFGNDLWLIDRVQKLYADQSPSSITQLLNILDYVVLKKYQVQEPTFLSQFYRSAVGKGNKIALTKDYSAIVDHMNSLVEIEPELIQFGLNAFSNEDNARMRSQVYDAQSPYNYESSSYGGFIQRMIDDGSRKMSVDDALSAFQDHFKRFKDSSLEVMPFVKEGYINVLVKVYQRHSQDPNTEGLRNELKNLNEILQHLDQKGFNVYRSQTINTIDNYAGNNQIGDLERLTNCCHRNYLILKLGMMLKE